MFLPLFPLQLVAFPGEDVHLHIFEPRYKQLIQECKDNGLTFGIPPYHDGAVAMLGTEMALTAIDKVYPTGEMDILTRGLHAFRIDAIVRVVPKKLYSGGNVLVIPNDAAEDGLTRGELLEKYARLHELLKTGRSVDALGQENVSYQMAHEVGLNTDQKIRLLAMAKEMDRQSLIVDHLRIVIPIMEAAEDTKSRVTANGRFKKLPSVDL